ncbi:hypothetical protein LH462_02705 [Laribacter hongkongensis]|uniref:Uncharacterized protein n=1 Tax=Laribacter hongkongensis TaxID=168471 RepID=A0ABD4SRP0_9NEIS|nr:hypothetical protein [Laribacter hongkongensis]MCG9025667.1 hypothetical protein [Laribacter hongkongensis]MCG9100066.1 hypothetical protein [Laribacter hongkongensis]MCG9102641.1 hypothetical protein [Laribacter hongkongensis]MCG9112954.1 hypothetical protein [Laribacter hongkongensis]MCG9118099.1 hypothetical protein [Laribacter hongkongensis]
MTALARSLRGCFVPACGLPDMRQAFGGLNLGWTGIKDRVGGAGRRDEQLIRHGDQPLKRCGCLAAPVLAKAESCREYLEHDRQPIHCAIKAPGLHVALQ